MWKRLLEKDMKLLHPDVNFSLLTKLSENWTLGAIEKVVKGTIRTFNASLVEARRVKKERDEDVLAAHAAGGRVVSMGTKKIRMEDFCHGLSENEPIFLEQAKCWNTWFNKTPLQKARMATQFAHKSGDKKGKKDKKGNKKRG